MTDMINKALAQFLIEKFPKDGIISELFDFLGFDCIQKSQAYNTKLDNFIREFNKNDEPDARLLTDIIKLLRENKAGVEQAGLLGEIKGYINEHLFDDISIEDIAREHNFSYYYMCHFFKANAGVSVNGYRQQKRLEAALKRLVSRKEKITDIASECGFNNVSYFTEAFTKAVGLSPTAFREKNKCTYFHSFYNYEDILLAGSIPSKSFMGDITEPEITVERNRVSVPTDEFGFLHETAIIGFKGVLYASWYCNPKTELQGYTPVCGRRSYDGGKSWSEPEIIAEDKSGKILYCPPVYGICDGKLYMLINEMVKGDYMHALDLFVLNENSGKFEFLWSKPIPFKLNTNVVALPNGKLMLPGRIAEMDSFPNTPAVLISDSGKIDAEWRLVKIAENGNLPNGNAFVHPELTVICADDILYMFSRNDQRRVPIVYTSRDFGESWSGINSHDVPYNNSKIYSGTLSSGRHFMVCNTDNFVRERLVLYVTDGKELKFTKKAVLFDRYAKPLENEENVVHSHYPSAYEYNGKLYIIATTQYVKDNKHTRGAYLYIVDLKEI